MRNRLLWLLAAIPFCCSCDNMTDSGATQQAATRQGYMQQMAAPSVEARTYLSLYTTHKVECESGDSFQRRYSCTKAKVDLAHVQRAWGQALAIAEQMAQDSALSDKDRNEAQQAAEQLRDGIQRIQSAKPGKLPQL